MMNCKFSSKCLGLVLGISLLCVGVGRSQVIVDGVTTNSATGPFATIQAAVNYAITTGPAVVEIQTDGPLAGFAMTTAMAAPDGFTVRGGTGYFPNITSGITVRRATLLNEVVLENLNMTHTAGFPVDADGNITLRGCTVENTAVADPGSGSYGIFCQRGTLNADAVLRLENCTVIDGFCLNMGTVPNLVAVDSHIKSRGGAVNYTAAHVTGWPTQNLTFDRCVLENTNTKMWYYGAVVYFPVLPVPLGLTENNPIGTLTMTNCTVIGGSYNAQILIGAGSNHDTKAIIDHCTFRRRVLDTPTAQWAPINLSRSDIALTVTNSLFDVPTTGTGTTAGVVVDTMTSKTLAGDANVYNLNTSLAPVWDTAAAAAVAQFETDRYVVNGWNNRNQFVTDATGHLGHNGYLPGLEAASNNAVVTSPSVTVDIDGEARPQGGGPDIGSDEWPYVPVELSEFAVE